VLFLDEIAEFPRHVLESLRQPLEDGEVSISRAQQATRFPCRCLVVAAMNPCPCGHLGSRLRSCTCSSHEIERYRNRLSGPLLDRFDLHLEIPAILPEDLEVVPRTEMDTPTLAACTRQARAVSQARQGKLLNGQLGGLALRESCALESSSKAFLVQASRKLALSARAHERILRVARSVADLDAQTRVSEAHLAEALAFRAVVPRTGPV
jgi:magnesium chelatase family protein